MTHNAEGREWLDQDDLTGTARCLLDEVPAGLQITIAWVVAQELEMLSGLQDSLVGASPCGVLPPGPGGGQKSPQMTLRASFGFGHCP